MRRLIRDISDTARWVAVFRADESDRPDALFHDLFARRLAGRRGRQIANAIEFSRAHSWAAVARTVSFDDIVKQHVAKGFDTVVNLGAGLDTRPYRMDLPASLQWIEVDLPAMIAYKDTVLSDERPVCALQRISLDLSDGRARRAFFSDVGGRTKKALIVSEGVIAYLDRRQAASLARDLSRQPAFRRWVLDMLSPGLLAMAREQMGSFLEQANAPLQFAPRKGEEFFRPYGWRSLESRSNLKTAARLRRLSDEMMGFAAAPEPEGPKGSFFWSGVCLFENIARPAPTRSFPRGIRL